MDIDHVLYYLLIMYYVILIILQGFLKTLVRGGIVVRWRGLDVRTLTLFHFNLCKAFIDVTLYTGAMLEQDLVQMKANSNATAYSIQVCASNLRNNHILAIVMCPHTFVHIVYVYVYFNILYFLIIDVLWFWFLPLCLPVLVCSPL